MSRGDFWVVDTRGSMAPVAVRYTVALGTSASIKTGEWVVKDDEDVKLAVNGQSNTVNWIGVAASDSNETTALKGQVYVYDNPDYIFRGFAATKANLTATVRNTEVTLDVASGTNGAQTVDENDTSNGTLRIVDFNATEGTVDVQMSDPMMRA